MQSTSCPECGAPLDSKCARPNVGHCRNCRISFVVPLPSEETIRGLYDDTYYRTWAAGNGTRESAENGTFPSYWEQKIVLFRDLLRGTPKPIGAEKGLDVGCATGACLQVLGSLGWRASGTDINPHAVGIARSLVPEAQVYEGTIDDLPPDEQGFGLIVLSDLLEHVTDPTRVLARVFELLTPGGHVVILTPDIDSLSCRLMGTQWPHYKAEHPVLFGRRSIARLLAARGFDAIRVSPLHKPITLEYAELQFRGYA